MTTAEFTVSGMSCGHCETAIRTEVGAVTGVDGVQVSAATGRLIVTSGDPVDETTILKAVEEAGYTAVPA